LCHLVLEYLFKALCLPVQLYLDGTINLVLQSYFHTVIRWHQHIKHVFLVKERPRSYGCHMLMAKWNTRTIEV